MRNNKFFKLLSIAVFSLGCIGCMIAVILLIKNGILRDEEGITGNDNFFSAGGLFIALFLNFLMAANSFAIYRLLKSKQIQLIVKIFYMILIVTAISFSAVCFISINGCFNQNEYNKLVTISLENLESMETDKKTGIVLIGRNNCSVCVEVFPEINRLLNEKDANIMFFNNTADRESIPETMYKILDEFQIHSVPMIVIFNNGEISCRLSEDTLLEELEIYIQNDI